MTVLDSAYGDWRAEKDREEGQSDPSTHHSLPMEQVTSGSKKSSKGVPPDKGREGWEEYRKPVPRPDPLPQSPHPVSLFKTQSHLSPRDHLDSPHAPATQGLWSPLLFALLRVLIYVLLADPTAPFFARLVSGSSLSPAH